MTYLDRIEALKSRLEAMGSPARLDLPFIEGRPPTQAFSEFLTNKEQGDWAEATFLVNFNRAQADFWAVKYGRSENLVAGEPGFDEYYRAYQAELQEIGKRPDLLIFRRAAFEQEHGHRVDISTMPRADLERLVPGAVAAIEVRSSAFLSARYQAAAEEARSLNESQALAAARQLLQGFRPELADHADWIAYLEAMMAGGIDPSALGQR